MKKLSIPLFAVALFLLPQVVFAQDKQTKDPLKDFTNSIGMKFVWIKPGDFTMGSPKEETEREAHEVQHKVTITKGFYMGIHLVTQEQWEAVMGNNPSRSEEVMRRDRQQSGKNPSKLEGKGKLLPVENVTWNDCLEFIKKLRAKDQKEYRLPSEAEWEYSCRAGTTTPFHCGETISNQRARQYQGTSVSFFGPTPVGTFPANGLGLYDMHGNVWQWCQDWYGEYPRQDVIDPQGPATGVIRVLRGGSWREKSNKCRSASRYACAPTSVKGPGSIGGEFGFRICFYLAEDATTKNAPILHESKTVRVEQPNKEEPGKKTQKSDVAQKTKEEQEKVKPNASTDERPILFNGWNEPPRWKYVGKYVMLIAYSIEYSPHERKYDGLVSSKLGHNGNFRCVLYFVEDPPKPHREIFVQGRCTELKLVNGLTIITLKDCKELSQDDKTRLQAQAKKQSEEKVKQDALRQAREEAEPEALRKAIAAENALRAKKEREAADKAEMEWRRIEQEKIAAEQKVKITAKEKANKEAAEKAERERPERERARKEQEEATKRFLQEKSEAIGRAKKEKDYLPPLKYVERTETLEGVKELLGQPMEIQPSRFLGGDRGFLYIWNRGTSGYVAIYFVDGGGGLMVRGGIFAYGVDRQKIDQWKRFARGQGPAPD